MKRLFQLITVLVVLSLTSCATYQRIPTSETVCISQEDDGSITVRVWGVGRNLLDAKAQARKQAVKEVIFNGIRNGNSSYTQTPLVSEANARTKYESYFDNFFSDDGPFADYISMEDRRWGSRVVKRSKTEVGACMTVRVFRSDLRQKLIIDGIIKK